MPIPASLKNFTRSILRCLSASALLLCLTTAGLHAAQEVVLRLDPDGSLLASGGILGPGASDRELTGSIRVLRERGRKA